MVNYSKVLRTWPLKVVHPRWGVIFLLPICPRFGIGPMTTSQRRCWTFSFGPCWFLCGKKRVFLGGGSLRPWCSPSMWNFRVHVGWDSLCLLNFTSYSWFWADFEVVQRIDVGLITLTLKDFARFCQWIVYLSIDVWDGFRLGFVASVHEHPRQGFNKKLPWRLNKNKLRKLHVFPH